MKAPPEDSVGIYHCVSRVVGRQLLLEEPEKKYFRSLMRQCEEFCEVRILTYCLMSNHVHLLLEVPQRPQTTPGMDEILTKLDRLTGHQNLDAVRDRLRVLRASPGEAGRKAEEQMRETYLARMWDVSAFMKLLKQRFTQWYNGRTGRRGTLWEERFKSVMVESAGPAVAAMAAYIDLNPVRAGLVQDPKEYRWSGYGEAAAGSRSARAGLQRLVQIFGSEGETAATPSMKVYGAMARGEAVEVPAVSPAEGGATPGGLAREDVVKLVSKRGRLPLEDYVKCRVRYFSDGAVFGSREFVDEVFHRFRERFGPKRKDGARRLRGLREELFALRSLRKNVFQ